jgi:hypothetical protein
MTKGGTVFGVLDVGITAPMPVLDRDQPAREVDASPVGRFERVPVSPKTSGPQAPHHRQGRAGVGIGRAPRPRARPMTGCQPSAGAVR